MLFNLFRKWQHKSKPLFPPTAENSADVITDDADKFFALIHNIECYDGSSNNQIKLESR